MSKDTPSKLGDVKDWSDFVEDDERRSISELCFDDPCPYFGRSGNFFCYCRSLAVQHKQFGSAEITDSPDVASAQYLARLSAEELKDWCLAGREQNLRCINFPLNEPEQEE